MGSLRGICHVGRLYHHPWLALLRRLLVSIIIAGPFLMGGVYGFAVGGFPVWASLVVLGVGALLMFIGLYMTFTGIVPSPPLLPDEHQLETRRPTMRPAYARMIFSLPFLASALYVWLYSESPYVYPFVLFVVGLYFSLKGQCATCETCTSPTRSPTGGLCICTVSCG